MAQEQSTTSDTESAVQERVTRYEESLTQLFRDIRGWLEQGPWKVEETQIELSEPRPGPYKVPMLTIRDEHGEKLVELRPGGAWIIGADWRLDIEGPVDTELLLYWAKGAPQYDSLSGGRLTVTPLFRGAEKPGWYWIQDKRLSRALPLDKDLLLDLVREVQG